VLAIQKTLEMPALAEETKAALLEFFGIKDRTSGLLI
jgi:hypothetical protein